MRKIFALAMVSVFVATAANAAIPTAPANWATDDIITLVYDPAAGSLSVDNPAGNDAAADAITTFELVASEDFFTGAAPPEINGLFDVWSPQKAFRLFPDGFYDMAWADGSVASGKDANAILTLSGSFLSGGALEPADLHVVPEPSSLALLGLGALGLAGLRRRK